MSEGEFSFCTKTIKIIEKYSKNSKVIINFFFCKFYLFENIFLNIQTRLFTKKIFTQ